MSAVPPEADSLPQSQNVRVLPILLKKSDSANELIISGALMRSSEDCVGDYVISPFSNVWASQALYQASDWRRAVSTHTARYYDSVLKCGVKACVEACEDTVGLVVAFGKGRSRAIIITQVR